jgi:hypothetical protein
MRGRILVVSFSELRSDARVLKQIRLLAPDHDVDTCGYGAAPDGVRRHYELRADRPIWRYSRPLVMLRRFRRAYWSNAAIVGAREVLPVGMHDVVLANDIDAVGLALSLDPVGGVHADLHEYAPRQREDLLRWRLFVAPFVRWMCRTFLPRASSVSTVGQGIADEYRRRFGVDATVVKNAAPFAPGLHPTDVGGTVRMVHSGAALADRNIAALCDAVEQSTAAVTLDLYLTPNDPAYLAGLAARADRSSRITLHDPVPYDELIATLNGYDVGVHLLRPVNFNNRWALPNKIFDYVQARLGVIVGPSPEMERLVAGFGLGAVTKGFDAVDLVAVLDGLTPDDVAGWKLAADSSAQQLSSASEVGGWARAIDRILAAARQD